MINDATHESPALCIVMTVSVVRMVVRTMVKLIYRTHSSCETVNNGDDVGGYY